MIEHIAQVTIAGIPQRRRTVDMQDNVIIPTPKSNFVTVLAWIFIAFTGFAAFISLLQNIMLTLFFPLDKMQEAFNRPEAQEHIPAVFIFLASHVRLFFFFFLVLSSLTLVTSIGLLKRKNWARIIFIALMLFGILWNIAGVLFQQFVFTSFPKMPVRADAPMPNFEVFLTVIKVFSAMMAIGFSILFGWLIKKLLSPDIMREFGK